MASKTRRFVPRFDTLEDRATPAQFNVPWGDPAHLTLSFAPDGTAAAAGTTSNLFAALDARMPRAQWQGAILRAAQTWSELTNLNVGVVADGGQAFGAAGPTQGDPRFGDLRVGGVPMAGSELGQGAPPDPFLSGTLAGDVFFNTSAAFTPDSLYAVALHEIGHAVGLGHSTDPRSVMFNHLNGNPTPAASDVVAVRALYGARGADLNEGKNGNATLKNATRIKYSQLSGGYDGSTPLAAYGDITTRTDVDIFWVKPLVGYSGPTTFRVQTAGLSQLGANVTLMSATGQTLAQGTVSSGGTLTLTLASVVPDQKYHIRVEAAPGAVAGVGRYGVGVTFNGLLRPTAMSLDQVLRGPYEALSPEDMFAFFKNPTTTLYGDDLHANDSVAFATNIPAALGYAANTRYTTTASLAAADPDFYRVRAPDVRTPMVLTATVRAVGPNGVVPRVEVFDGNGVRVAARVLVNGNGTYTIQGTGVGRGNYFARVSGTTTGNYALDVSFGTVAAADQTFAAGTIPTGGRGANYQLFVARTQLFGFNLTASGPLRATILNAAGQTVYTLNAVAGDVVTGPSVLLTPGAYTVRFELVGTAPAASPVSFRLWGTWFTDPVGPVAGNPTLAPQYVSTQNPITYIYPTGGVTFDPYLWAFASYW